MKSALFLVVLFVGFILAVFLGGLYYYNSRSVTPGGLTEAIEEGQKEKERPLEKYSFENLRQHEFSGSEISFGELLAEEDEYESRKFYFNSDGKRVSGVLNSPVQEGEYPVVIMFRGFVDRSIYQPGIGTQRGAEYLASNGFITLAPDFLGYGESDMESEDSIEGRFETYTTALNLFESIDTLNDALDASTSSSIRFDGENVGIWAHSNGGHIALSVLAISGRDYPTVLWAPVSKHFPYSILYYTDEFEDQGKALRKVVANFEELYDVDYYSTPNYYKWIQAPIQIHQGTLDDAVPTSWSETLLSDLEDLEIEAELFIYGGADHNLLGSWTEAIERSEEFYLEKFAENEEDE